MKHNIKLSAAKGMMFSNYHPSIQIQCNFWRLVHPKGILWAGEDLSHSAFRRHQILQTSMPTLLNEHMLVNYFSYIVNTLLTFSSNYYETILTAVPFWELKEKTKIQHKTVWKVILCEKNLISTIIM